jgi:hypothetical protein
METAPRRPLGAGIITLIVVDAVLVAVFLVMLVQLNGPGGGEPVAGSTTSSPADPNAETVVFASPTRNISCTIDGDSAGCEIAHILYEKPTVEGCDGDVGHEIEVTAESAHWVCRTESPPPSPGPEIENLDWGDSVTANGFTCTSANDGVTCRHDESGNSFSLARRVFTIT